MPKVTITSTGLNQIKEGSGLEITAALTQSPKYDVTAHTANATLTAGGVYTVSGTAVRTLTMPLASSVAGAQFIVRSLSEHAHVLTGSAETGGTKVFAGQPGTGALSARGSSLALPAVVGSSVALVSDGVNFLVAAASGSFAISGG